MPKPAERKQQFSVEYLPLAAALMAAGHPLRDLDKTNPRKAVFLFDLEAGEQAAHFIQGCLQVDAKRLFSCFEDLRTMIRSR